MGTSINNQKDLDYVLKKSLVGAVQYVVDKIYDTNAEVINKMIYYGGFTPKYYENLFEFDRSWNTAVHTTKYASAKGHDVSGEFFYDPSKLTIPQEQSPNHLGQHTAFSDKVGDNGEIQKGQDIRPYLAEIIYQGLAIKGAIHGNKNDPWAKKRNAFDSLAKIVGKQNLKKWFREGLEQQGFDVKTHNTSIKREGFDYN